MTHITLDTPRQGADLCILSQSTADWSAYKLTEAEQQYIARCAENKEAFVELNQYSRRLFLWLSDIEECADSFEAAEAARTMGHKVLQRTKSCKIKHMAIDARVGKEQTLAFAEGLLLGSYSFLKYMGSENREKKEHHLQTASLQTNDVSEAELHELQNLCEGVCFSRDLCNEPSITLDATELAKRVLTETEKHGCKVEVFEKERIIQEGFGGLLAVNKGSLNPPSFTIVEWKPANATNEKPYVFVGKGVTFDTGGISLKPGSKYMMTMQGDMAGAAAVAGLMLAAAKNKLNKYLIALLPATDNRPSGNAIVPSDVITMHSGSTVEVLNTDAEGRLLLADGLSYAKRYSPEFVIDVATLTGSAAHAIGSQAAVCMGNAPAQRIQQLITAGYRTHERLVQFPLWKEYAESLKSEIADIKNLGGAEAGAITAGKFLEHFVDYPWVHIDIAGPFHSEKEDNYRGQGFSAFGVRLLYQFLKNE